MYSFPNIILPVFGGFFLDRFGTNRVLIIFSLLVCLGQTLFAFGVALKVLHFTFLFPFLMLILTVCQSLWLMLLGRVIFGLGGESLGVAQGRITVRWFRNKEMAFALVSSLLLLSPTRFALLRSFLFFLLRAQRRQRIEGKWKVNQSVQRERGQRRSIYRHQKTAELRPG